jgi:hypothetical protein
MVSRESFVSGDEIVEGGDSGHGAQPSKIDYKQLAKNGYDLIDFSNLPPGIRLIGEPLPFAVSETLFENLSRKPRNKRGT